MEARWEEEREMAGFPTNRSSRGGSLHGARRWNGAAPRATLSQQPRDRILPGLR